MSIALITGASSGIGRALAHRFARAGHDIFLVARRPGPLEQAAKDLAAAHKVRATPIIADLSMPDGPGSVMSELDRRGAGIDVLINNAGMGHYGPFAEAPLDRYITMIRLNVEGLVALTRLVLPGMLARRHGRIANIASTGAFQPGPRLAVYYASKAFVLSFSEALAHELGNRGVTVTAVCPGPTPSGFQRESGLDRRGMPGVLSTSPDRVADVAYRAIMRGKRVVVPGLINRMLTMGSRLSPRWMTTLVVGWVNRERG